jgi:hypothetical protein
MALPVKEADDVYAAVITLNVALEALQQANMRASLHLLESPRQFGQLEPPQSFVTVRIYDRIPPSDHLQVKGVMG